MRRRIMTPVGTRSRTKQANRNEFDINLMVGRYMKTGVFSSINPKEPRYGDFSNALQLQDALELTRAAHEEFQRLPAKVRAAAQNDPLTMLAMLADPEGTKTLVDAGLPVKTPPPVVENPVVPDAGATSGGGVS